MANAQSNGTRPWHRPTVSCAVLAKSQTSGTTYASFSCHTCAGSAIAMCPRVPVASWIGRGADEHTAKRRAFGKERGRYRRFEPLGS